MTTQFPAEANPHALRPFLLAHACPGAAATTRKLFHVTGAESTRALM